MIYTPFTITIIHHTAVQYLVAHGRDDVAGLCFAVLAEAQAGQGLLGVQRRGARCM
jgi:hypothetical protein